MPLLETKGVASAQGFGGFARTTAAVYIEDVFSCFLYTGNGSTQTITNGIDLSGEGGLVWIKGRSVGYSHGLFDTIRGADYWLNSASNDASTSISGIPANAWITGFNSNGFGLGTNASVSNNGTTYTSWTFRKAKKFFDIVTYTGNGSNRTISHNLGSVPGWIIVKCTSSGGAWTVYHRSTGSTKYLLLNSSDAAETLTGMWNNTDPTATEFTLGASGFVNGNGATYIAYLFAHDAGGFGNAGSDNVISCGSFTTDGSGNATVSLGYEPQFLIAKKTSSTGDWMTLDNMRGIAMTPSIGSNDSVLKPNLSNAEVTDNLADLSATGFSFSQSPSTTYIYIAIRRGPMKTPTSGTEVFSPVAYSGTGTNSRQISSSITPDFGLLAFRNTTGSKFVYDRLRGNGVNLQTNDTSAEANEGATNGVQFNKVQTGYEQGTADSTYFNSSSYTFVNYLIKRAPGFFDEVCYTGTGSNLTVAHNLGAVPELIIAKNRTTAGNNWPVLFNFTSTNQSYGFLNLTSAGGNDTYANVGVMTAQPTSTNMYLSSSGSMNTSTNGHVAYLFASCPGVSKVGSYTGTGALQTVNCGFSGGARFVLIKRTDSTGDWWVYDSARGISSGNDPYLYLNSTAAEVTNTNYVDTTSVGFQVTAAAPAGLNANGGSYIFLAIA